MHTRLLFLSISILLISSCTETRIKEHNDWGKYYARYGIKDACIIMRDNNHESIHYFNKDQCLQRYLPASTFKIFNSLVALETAVAPDDQFTIKWDGIPRRAEWNKDMNMREAFKVSCLPYYQEIARRIGLQRMQHYLDTVKYGNMFISGGVDSFWLNNSLQISADEEMGFVKRLYFNELPFSERSQRIVRSMMLHEETPQYKLYYKTGWGFFKDKQILWITGYAERIENVKEDKDAMNKSNVRNYPYFFSQNIILPASDTTKDWGKIRVDLLKDILRDYGVLPQN